MGLGSVRFDWVGLGWIRLCLIVGFGWVGLVWVGLGYVGFY